MNNNQLAYYNPETDSVDIILDSHTLLRLSCKTIFPTIQTTPATYQHMVRLSQESPALFAELVLDHCLESYLNTLG